MRPALDPTMEPQPVPHQVQVRHTVLRTLQGKLSPCGGLVPEDPISKCGSPGLTEGYLAPSQAALSPADRGWPRASVRAFRLHSYQLGRSDLGPPAFDELHDLLDLKLGEVEIVSQDVLTELHKDTAIDPFSGKEAHHVLGEPDETQAARDLLQRERRQVGGGLPGGLPATPAYGAVPGTGRRPFQAPWGEEEACSTCLGNLRGRW